MKREVVEVGASESERLSYLMNGVAWSGAVIPKGSW
jgi:hypothetical protein